MTYTPTTVALVLVREVLLPGDRIAVIEAARRYIDRRTEHEEFIASMPSAAEQGMVAAGQRALAAAEFVARTFEGHPPDQHALDAAQVRENLMALTVQQVFDTMDPPLRQRFKDQLRICARFAKEPLNDEVALFVELCDSWEAWELEQQLDMG